MLGRRQCEGCQRKGRESAERWKKRHPGEHNKRQKQWYQNNVEAERPKHRRWYRDNKEAERAARLLRLYGITPERYDAMLTAQGGHCAICLATEPGGKGTWHVDHKHADGFKRLPPEEKRKSVRGLLCNDCNHGIGKLKDSPELLRAAAAYLERPPLFE